MRNVVNWSFVVFQFYLRELSCDFSFNQNFDLFLINFGVFFIFSVYMSIPVVALLLSGNSAGSRIHRYSAIHLFSSLLYSTLLSIECNSFSSFFVKFWVPNELFPHLHPPQRGVQPIPRFSML